MEQQTQQPMQEKTEAKPPIKTFLLVALIAVVISVGGILLLKALQPAPSTVMEMSTVSLCDLNADGQCDATDQVLFQQALGKKVGEIGYSLSADVDADGVVTARDQQVLFPMTSPAPSPQVLDTSAWQTYRNEEYGFEIKYPAGWQPVEIRDGLGRKQLYSLGAPGAQYNGFSVDGYPYEKSVDDFFDEHPTLLETAEGVNYTLSEVKDTIVGGERAIEIPNLSNAKYYEERVIFVEHNEFIYQIIVPTRFESFDSIIQVDEEEVRVFDQILSTFRFTK